MIDMKLKIVYDNEVFKKNIGLRSDWGFACLITTERERILFDTGANGAILLENMKILNIKPEDIDKIVISHEHSDHNGGLSALVSNMKNIDVYRLARDINDKKTTSIFPEIPESISKGVWTTGKISGLVDEQSLVLEGKSGWYVLTGCSHPGIEKILDISKEIGDIVGIIGGFHGFNRFKLVEHLDFICPCHCTTHKDDLKKAFPDKTPQCGVGQVFDLGDRT
jgi:7,8-dihydropterin-6-yl-methyl-4-(beta-D-ribofuranosyl)aminobenzene 5'-phosphate synthase